MSGPSRRALLAGLGAGALVGAAPRGAWAQSGSDNRTIHSLLDQDAGWAARADLSRDGVSVASRTMPDPSVPAFRGLLEVAAPAIALWDTIYDVAGHKAVSGMLHESRVLWDNGTTMHYYQVSKVPAWVPVSERYWFLQSQSTRDRGGVAGHNKRAWNPLDAAATYPEALAQVQARYPGSVSPKFNHGSWEVIPQGAARCTLVYRIWSHPGGNISDSLAYQMSSRTLPDNLLNFKRAAEARG